MEPVLIANKNNPVWQTENHIYRPLMEQEIQNFE
jgi:hypothetical protein